MTAATISPVRAVRSGAFRRGVGKRRMVPRLPSALLSAACLLLAGCSTPSTDQPVSGQRQAFFVGGSYLKAGDGEVLQGAMYVEHLRPRKVTQKFPLVLVHGAAQTSMNWITKPDGAPGWAEHFVGQGYEVYLVDQPQRGRSAWHPDLDGKLRTLSSTSIERLFTAPAHHAGWPQARWHTQWPGTGRKGDPVFDQFYASQVAYVGSTSDNQRAAQAAGVALLDRIGPAVLVTHSQGGPVGWLIADARPHNVKAIVAIEPSGPPIQAGPEAGGGKRLAWGVSDVPITYTPPALRESDLRVEQQAAAVGPDRARCWIQSEPARQLTRLQNIPVVILMSEASYHAGYDHCTAAWLSQAGVRNTLMPLAEAGLRGNGHMMMLEKNSDAIASLIGRWVRQAVASP